MKEFFIDLNNGVKYGCKPMYDQDQNTLGYVATIEADHYDANNGIDVFLHKDLGVELVASNCCEFDFEEIDSDIVNIKKPAMLTVWCPERPKNLHIK